jgi:hypothetical protein
MNEYFFGLHRGHLKAKADQIAKKHGAWHVNFTEPNGEKRGWFGCDNLGHPFDSGRANAVMADIEKAGGIESLQKKGAQ